jgi:hypothetical protein
MKPSPQAQTGIDARGKPLQGLKNGKVSELAMLYKVKPGHEAQIRDAIYAFCNDPKRDPIKSEAAVIKTGVHEVRFVLFDNDTRLMWLTTFDTDWDPYIDDTLALIGASIYGAILQHCENTPAGMEKPGFPNANAAVKDLFNSARITAAGLLVTLNTISTSEQVRNRNVRQAFDAALENPGAAKALEHPALKPLLDLAAD